jgi:hypothetical protein
MIMVSESINSHDPNDHGLLINNGHELNFQGFNPSIMTMIQMNRA